MNLYKHFFDSHGNHGRFLLVGVDDDNLRQIHAMNFYFLLVCLNYLHDVHHQHDYLNVRQINDDLLRQFLVLA